MQSIICLGFFRNAVYWQEQRLVHKLIFDMDHMYFRQADSSETLNISFRYASEQYKIDREFNFCRNINENVADCAHRMNVNLDKVFQKKSKKKGKVSTPEISPPTIDVKFYKNGEVVSTEETCKDILKEHPERITVHVVDKIYKVILNAPWIHNVQLPNSILAGFPIYPSKLDIQFITPEQCKFTWYKGKFDKTKNREEHVKWELIGEGFIIQTRNEDVGCKIKVHCEPKDTSLVCPHFETVSTNDVQAGPGICPFDTRHLFTKERLEEKCFRVCSYNILADLYCDSDFTRTTLHPYCPPYALAIDYRKQLILKELLGYNFDIAFLQEVDCKVFDYDLCPVLRSEGYEGVFKKKGATVAEGLAVFYNKRYSLISSLGIILGEHIMKDDIFRELWIKIENNAPLVERICQRTTAVQAVLLECLDYENHIVIAANTHLYFHPDADHIRLLQFGFAISWVHNILHQTKSQFPDKKVSLVFCGDFNSVPQCGIYQLMTTQHVPETIPDWSSNAEEAVTGVSLSQNIKMGSACGTPQYTNFTTGFADCLDYIFYQEDSFDVEQVVPLPSIEELQMHTALPSIVMPSDHIALVADLKWKESK